MVRSREYVAENFETREWLVRVPGSSETGLLLQCGGGAGRAGEGEVGACCVSRGGGQGHFPQRGLRTHLAWTCAMGSQERGHQPSQACGPVS